MKNFIRDFRDERKYIKLKLALIVVISLLVMQMDYYWR